MANTRKITKQNIDKITFLKAMEEMSVLLERNRNKLAQLADINYDTYKHYMYGRGSDTKEAKEIYWKIYRAAIKLIKGNQPKILTALSHTGLEPAHIS